jgi:hypothetical protein
VTWISLGLFKVQNWQKNAQALEPLHQLIFVLGIFKIGSGKLFSQGWPQNAILLISASQVARITATPVPS